MSNQIVTDEASPLFRGIADPLRRSILDLLVEGPRAVEEIASHFPVSRPAISRHLRVLKDAGLLAEERSGRQRFYALIPEELAPIREWLEGLAAGGAPEPRRVQRSRRAGEAARAAAGTQPGVGSHREPRRATSLHTGERGGDPPAEEDWRSW